MTRAELFAQVADEINRKDKTDRIPGWLSSAEFRINNLLRDRRMVQRAILPLDSGYFTTPSDFLEAESLSVQHRNLVDDTLQPGGRIGTPKYVSADVYDDTPADYVCTPAFPKWFTTRGAYIELVGWISTQPIQAQLFYYAKLPKLTADVSTNWLLDEAPHIYVYAIAALAFQHLEEYDTAQRHLEMVSAECQAMNDRTQEMKTLSGPLIKQRAPAIGVRGHRR